MCEATTISEKFIECFQPLQWRSTISGLFKVKTSPNKAVWYQQVMKQFRKTRLFVERWAKTPRAIKHGILFYMQLTFLVRFKDHRAVDRKSKFCILMTLAANSSLYIFTFLQETKVSKMTPKHITIKREPDKNPNTESSVLLIQEKTINNSNDITILSLS